MKRMKRAGLILAVAVMICGLTACGGSEKDSKTSGGAAQGEQDRDAVQGGWETEPGSGQEAEPGDGSDDGQEAGADNEWSAGTDTEAEADSKEDPEDGQEPKQDDEQDVDPEDGQDGEQNDDTDAVQGGGQDTNARTADDYAFSSNDWKTLEFALDGEVYAFPLTWSDIEAAGFLIDEDYRHEVLESNYYTLSVNAENEAGERISVRFKNFEEGDRELQDCYLYGIGFDQSEWRDVNPDVMLCNGVTFGMTVEEVKALMGEPDYFYESEGDDYSSMSMDYYVTGHSYENEIDFYFWNGVLTEIDILNKD